MMSTFLGDETYLSERLYHMNIKDRAYSSILSLVKKDIYFRCQILRRTEKYSHCNTLEQILNLIYAL